MDTRDKYIHLTLFNRSLHKNIYSQTELLNVLKIHTVTCTRTDIYILTVIISQYCNNHESSIMTTAMYSMYCLSFFPPQCYNVNIARHPHPPATSCTSLTNPRGGPSYPSIHGSPSCPIHTNTGAPRSPTTIAHLAPHAEPYHHPHTHTTTPEPYHTHPPIAHIAPSTEPYQHQSPTHNQHSMNHHHHTTHTTHRALITPDKQHNQKPDSIDTSPHTTYTTTQL